MHQRTYLRLRDRYEAAVEQYVGPMAASLKKRGGPDGAIERMGRADTVGEPLSR